MNTNKQAYMNTAAASKHGHGGIRFGYSSPLDQPEPDYDPTDLAFLVHGWTRAVIERDAGIDMTITIAEDLEDAARVLHALYLEVRDDWSGVWAYEVAEPLGVWVGGFFADYGDMPHQAIVEEAARSIVDNAMENM